MLTRVVSTRVDHSPPGSLPPLHTASDCRLSAPLASLSPASLPSPLSPSRRSPSCQSGGCLFPRRAPAAPAGSALLARVAFTRDSDSPRIRPTINKTSRSWQINLLVNGARPPGLSLLLMSRLLRSFLRRLPPSLPGRQTGRRLRAAVPAWSGPSAELVTFKVQWHKRIKINIQQSRTGSLQINAADDN